MNDENSAIERNTRGVESTNRKRLPLQDSLFDEFERRAGRTGTYSELLEKTGISRNTMDRLLTGNTNPYFGTRRKLRKFLRKNDAELDQMLALTAETGSQDGGQVETSVADITTVDSSAADIAFVATELGDRTSKAKQALQLFGSWQFRAMLLALPIALLGLLFFLREPPTCLVDFRKTINSKLRCSRLGDLVVEGSVMDGWNNRVSAIQVPDGWTVRIKYENWVPPKYDHIDQNGNGFILLNTGINEFYNIETYPLFRDFELTEFVKMTEAGELNDRIQYIVITSHSKNDKLKIFAHKELDNPEQLSVKSF